MREHASYLRGSRVYTRKGEYKTWPGYLCRVIGGVTSFHEAIRFLLNYSNFEPVVGMSSFNIDHQQLFFTFCRFAISLDFFETVSVFIPFSLFIRLFQKFCQMTHIYLYVSLSWFRVKNFIFFIFFVNNLNYKSVQEKYLNLKHSSLWHKIYNIFFIIK